jgi:DNA-binding MarR family transcriptional regulator
VARTIARPNLVDALFQLSFILQGALGRIAAQHGLSVIQVRLLGILRDREPSMLELARYLELEKSSLSGLVDRAQAQRLVERIPSRDDRRVANVCVTAQGRKLSAVVERQVTAEVEALVAALPRPERARLASLASRVVASSTSRS